VASNSSSGLSLLKNVFGVGIGRQIIAAEFPTQGSRKFELPSMDFSRLNKEFDTRTNFLTIRT
jgi:hypothetical protein